MNGGLFHSSRPHQNLRASHQAGLLVLELSDDGHGVDLEKVRRSIVERQLSPAETAAQAPAPVDGAAAGRACKRDLRPVAISPPFEASFDQRQVFVHLRNLLHQAFGLDGTGPQSVTSRSERRAATLVK